MWRVLGVLIIALIAAHASAGVSLDLDQPYREAERGDYLIYTGSITNTGDRVLQVGIGFYGPDGFIRDWYSNLGFNELAPGYTYTGELFSFFIDGAASYDLHEARIDLAGYDLYDSEMFVDTKYITVDVVPEPSTAWLLLPLLGLFARRRCGKPVDKSNHKRFP
jgi:hypothetical protein